MTLEMRELSAKDTFAVLRLAKKMGISNSIVGLFKQQEKANDLMSEQKALLAKKVAWQLILEKNPDSKEAKKAQVDIENADERLSELTDILNEESFDLIMEVVEMVISNLDGLENELYKFLGSLCDKSPEDFSNISLIDFVGVLKGFFEKPELKQVAELFMPSNKQEESTSLETGSTNVIPMQEI